MEPSEWRTWLWRWRSVQGYDIDRDKFVLDQHKAAQEASLDGLYGGDSSSTSDDDLPPIEAAKNALLDKILIFLDDWPMGGERDSLLRLRLLIVLQENSGYFFSDLERLEDCIGAFAKIASSNLSKGHTHFIRHVVVAMTCILVGRGTLKHSSQLLTSVVDLLLGIIQMTDKSHMRLLRASAAHSLTEMELCWPGLLSASLGHLLDLCRRERTLAHPRYAALLLTVLKHRCNRQGSAPLLDTTVPLRPFVLQGDIGGCSDSDDVLRCIMAVVDTLSTHTPYSIAYAARMLIDIVPASGLDTHLFKHHMMGYVTASHPLLVHMMLNLINLFPNAFSDDDKNDIATRIDVLLNDFTVLADIRQLCTCWLMKSDNLHLPHHHDPLSLIEARLVHAATRKPTMSLLNPLVGHKYGSSGSLESMASLRVTLAMAQCNTDLHPDIVQYWCSVARANPHYAPCYFALAEMCGLLGLDALCSNLYSSLTSSINHVTGDDLSMVERLFQNPSVDPTALLSSLYIHVCSVCGIGQWSEGHAIVLACDGVTLAHGTAKVIGVVRSILVHIAKYWANVDVRDIAATHCQLISLVSGEKLRAILSGPDLGVVAAAAEELADMTPFRVRKPITESVPPFLSLIRRPADRWSSVDCEDSKGDEGVWEDAAMHAIEKHPDHSNDTIVLPLVLTCSDTGPVYGIEVSLSGDVETTLHVPRLSHDTVWPIDLPLCPTSATPGRIVGTAEFTDATGRTNVSECHPFELRFEDAFVPLGSAALFVLLWRCCLHSGGIEAVKVSNSPVDRILQRLRPFLVSIINPSTPPHCLCQKGGEDEEEIHIVSDERDPVLSEHRALIRVVPDWHVLMRILVHSDRAIVHVRTDNAALLRHLDASFDRLFM